MADRPEGLFCKFSKAPNKELGLKKTTLGKGGIAAKRKPQTAGGPAGESISIRNSTTRDEKRKGNYEAKNKTRRGEGG